MVRIVFGMDELLLTLGFLLQALCVIWIIFYIRNKRESKREVTLADEPTHDENDIIVTDSNTFEQTIGRFNHNRDYFIPLRETKKDFLPKKKIKSHKLVERKFIIYRRPGVYTREVDISIVNLNRENE